MADAAPAPAEGGDGPSASAATSRRRETNRRGGSRVDAIEEAAPGGSALSRKPRLMSGGGVRVPARLDSYEPSEYTRDDAYRPRFCAAARPAGRCPRPREWPPLLDTGAGRGAGLLAQAAAPRPRAPGARSTPRCGARARGDCRDGDQRGARRGGAACADAPRMRASRGPVELLRRANLRKTSELNEALGDNDWLRMQLREARDAQADRSWRRTEGGGQWVAPPRRSEDRSRNYASRWSG